MHKIKTLYLFLIAIPCYAAFVFLVDKNAFLSFLFGLVGFILLLISIIRIARGKIPEGDKIICPRCKGQSREYRSMAIKIFIPGLFLTPKYICMECKKLFNKPYQPKDTKN